ncbi:MAG: cyclase family protein [candidate division NC10 bacterium]|nr:cyclase family protein [candidate division NC10 bacterium]
MTLYDISVPIREGMPVWPGDPEVRIRRALALARGDPANVSALSLGAHTGTHLDAPYHFLEDGVPIDQIPLDLCVGEARVVEVPAPVAIGPAALEGLPVGGCVRLLLKTRNSSLWRREGFQEDFVFLTAEGAASLVAAGVRLLGIDYLSVEGYRAVGAPAHLTLLRAGMFLLEGIDLGAVPPGDYELLCLPLRVTGAEGAPARALLRTLR